MNKMIPFSPPRIDQRTLDAVNETLQSGWITTGPKTKLFEKQLTAYCGNRKTLCLNSATASLELMLRWFGVGPGDEVIVPAYTYCATANVVVHCGAKPVFADTGVDFNIDVSKLSQLINSKTKAIMPVDIGGFPCDYNPLMELLNEENIKSMFAPKGHNQQKLGRILLLADAAHSIGARYNGKMSGSCADASAFSFHAVKNLTTAEGGAIALNLPQDFDVEEVYRELNIKSLHGQSKDALAKNTTGGWRYDVLEAGYKCNMTDMQAAIGLIELERYESETLKRRRQIFDAYSKQLNAFDWAQIPQYQTEDKTSSYHVYLLRIRDITENQRDAIIDKIFEQQVSVNVHFQPVPMLSFYKAKGYNVMDYPVAFDNYSREISLPVYFDLTDEQVQQVTDTVINAVNSVIK